MGIDPEHRVHAVVSVGQGESRLARVDPGTDRDNGRNAGFAGALDGAVRVLEGVEVRVGVDHASAARSIRASSSATTCSGSSLRNSGRGSRSVRPGASELGCQVPAQFS